MKRFIGIGILLLAAAGSAAAQTWESGGYPFDEGASAGTSYEAPALPTAGAGGYDPAYDTGIDPVYSTPDSAPASHEPRHAFIPHEAYFERFGDMRVRGGHGHLRVTNAFVSLPLIDPSAVTWMGWSFDAKLSLRETWLDGSAEKTMDEKRISMLGLHASAAHAIGQQSQVQAGFTPNIATDFDQISSHDFYLGGYAAFASRFSPNFSYSVGVALMPSYYEHYVLPLVNFRYRTPQQWELALEATRLSFHYARWEQFRFGPFLQWNNSVWTLRRDHRTEQLRLSNILVGVGANGFVRLGQAKLSALCDVGASVHNSIRFKDKTGSHTLEKYHAKPGWYIRAGLGLQF